VASSDELYKEIERGHFMYRKVEDFLADFNASSTGVLKVIQAITEDKKDYAIVDGHNSLEWLAWHIVSVAGAFGQFANLNVPVPGPEMPTPETIAEIANYYEQVIEGYNQTAPKLTDAQLEEEVNVFGGAMPLGKVLRMVVDHQNHHRSQMTVLLRQAGLVVPPVMGPTAEMSK
jgi:uncharacterized damage-inducible protein DinB